MEPFPRIRGDLMALQEVTVTDARGYTTTYRVRPDQVERYRAMDRSGQGPAEQEAAEEETKARAPRTRKNVQTKAEAPD
jgi:hypothetical protein